MATISIAATLLFHKIICVLILSLPATYINFQSCYKVIFTFDLVEYIFIICVQHTLWLCSLMVCFFHDKTGMAKRTFDLQFQRNYLLLFKLKVKSKAALRKAGKTSLSTLHLLILCWKKDVWRVMETLPSILQKLIFLVILFFTD